MAVVSSYHSRLDQSSCLFSPFQSQHPVLLARKPVIVNKEFFQFPNKLFAQIAESFDVGPAVSILLYSNDSIVSDLLLLITLLPLDNAYGPAFENASWKGGFIHQHQNVNRI